MEFNMRVCRTIRKIQEFVNERRAKGDLIGLVPTMGYLHEGHLSLMRRAKEQCNTVVISIFVNPLQFGPQEDFASYPRDFERDAAMAQGAGVDAVFLPEQEEMYPPRFCSYVEVTNLTEKLCGASRPGHFRGVTTVVAKLFNIVQPDFAYFGQKDAQQVVVIQRMVADLNMKLTVVAAPTVREPDGLAMSSRNSYLSPEERQAATVLYQSLEAARRSVAAGERSASKIRELVMAMIRNEKRAIMEYVEIYCWPDLEPLATLQGQALLALAIRIGKTRLIDNTILAA